MTGESGLVGSGAPSLPGSELRTRARRAGVGHELLCVRENETSRSYEVLGGWLLPPASKRLMSTEEVHVNPMSGWPVALSASGSQQATLFRAS